MIEALKDALASIIQGALSSFDTTVENTVDILTGQGSLFDVETVWNLVLTLSDILKPFCYALIGICLLIELAQVAQKVDLVKWEHGIKICIKMVFAKLCIDFAPTFLKAVFDQSVEWAKLIGSSYKKLGAIISPYISTVIEKVDGWGILGLFVTVGLVALAIWISGLLLQVIAFGRIFEIYVYLAVSPLPCAFFPIGDGNGGGFNRITMKFFKSFIAVCLQGIMMLVVIRIFGSIIQTSFESAIADAMLIVNKDTTIAITDLCFTMLLGSLVLMLSVTKCGQWAKNIMDAM